jgi:hypothetical protein
MRKKYPAAKITIAADNDQFNEDGYNPGLTKAKEAAVAIKACVVIPEFLNKSKKPTDFNELLILEGAEKVKEFFAKAEENNSICESMVDGFRLTENALSYYDERRKDYVYVSGYIKVIAQTEDSDGENTGKLIEVRTRRGQIRRLRIHNYWLAKDGDKMRELLLKIGFKISANHKAKLMLAHSSREHMISKLAYRIQELAFGGLSMETRKRMDQMSANINGSIVKKKYKPLVGAKIIKEYR